VEDDRHRKAGCAEILVALGADGLTVNGLSVSQLPAEKIPALLGTLASVQTALAARLLVAQGGPKASGHDQLLDAGAAAVRLGVSTYICIWKMYREALKTELCRFLPVAVIASIRENWIPQPFSDLEVRSLN